MNEPLICFNGRPDDLLDSRESCLLGGAMQERLGTIWGETRSRGRVDDHHDTRAVVETGALREASRLTGLIGDGALMLDVRDHVLALVEEHCP